jgi:hypothetical protein
VSQRRLLRPLHDKAIVWGEILGGVLWARIHIDVRMCIHAAGHAEAVVLEPVQHTVVMLECAPLHVTYNTYTAGISQTTIELYGHCRTKTAGRTYRI